MWYPVDADAHFLYVGADSNLEGLWLHGSGNTLTIGNGPTPLLGEAVLATLSIPSWTRVVLHGAEWAKPDAHAGGWAEGHPTGSSWSLPSPLARVLCQVQSLTCAIPSDFGAPRATPHLALDLFGAEGLPQVQVVFDAETIMVMRRGKVLQSTRVPTWWREATLQLLVEQREDSLTIVCGASEAEPSTRCVVNGLGMMTRVRPAAIPDNTSSHSLGVLSVT